MEEIIKILEENTPQQSAESILAVEQYNPDTHDVMNPNKRRDKTVYKPVLNFNGDPILNAEGKQITTPTLVKVNRVPIAFQKSVVDLKTYFMNFKGMVLSSNDDKSKLLEEINKVRKANKYLFKIQDIAKRTMSELSAAEMWWVTPENEIKMRVLSPAQGDLLLPLFDDEGDLKYFIRQYTTVEEETYTDIFTADFTYTFDENNEIVGDPIPNAWKKIPIIYYSQELPEWHDVQKIIERLETIISNLGDNNDYTGNPTTIIKGQVQGFAAKEDSGKVLILEENADVSYLTNSNTPESVKLEIEELTELMHTLSHTPNISIEALKGAGTSGTAFDRLFLDAQLSAEAKLSGTFGESMQRSVNLVSAILRTLNKSLPDDFIDVETEAFRFDDIETWVKNMVLLNGILSKESITKMTAGKYGIEEGEEWDRVLKESNSLSIEDAEGIE